MAPRSVVSMFVLSLCAVALSGCSSISPESASANMLNAADFSFDVEISDSPDEFAGPGATLFISEVAADDEAELADACAEAQEVAPLQSAATQISTVSFADRNDAQNNFRLNQAIIQTASPEDAQKIVAILKQGAANSDCEFSYSMTLTGASGYANEDFDNIRSADDSFGISSDASVAWDTSLLSIIDGVVFDQTSTEEGGTVVVAKNDLVIYFDYYSEDPDDSDEPVTRKDLEAVIAKVLQRTLG